MDNLNSQIPKIILDEDWKKETIKLANIILNAISILGGLVVVVVFLIFYNKQRTKVNKISLKLNFLISAIDVVRSIFIAAHQFSENKENVLCKVSAFFIIFLILVYMFYLFAIALNIHIVFLKERSIGSVLEVCLYVLPFFAGLAIASITYLTNNIGYDDAQEFCLYTDSLSLKTFIVEWITLLGWICIVCIYNTSIAFLVACKLYKESKMISNPKKKPFGTLRDSSQSQKSFNTDEFEDKAQNDIKNVIEKVAFRTVLYAFIPTITHMGFIISEVDSYFNRRLLFWVYVWSVVGTDSAGILNFYAFFYDNCIQNAIKDTFRKNNCEETPNINPEFLKADSIQSSRRSSISSML